MKTVRRKHNRRGTKRRHQRHHRTKKLYQYGGKSIISYQSGGVPPDNPEDIYDAGEEPADVEDYTNVDKILEKNPPESPRVRKSIDELFRYRFPDAEGRSCMYTPSKNTLIGKALEEQATKKLFKKYYPDDWQERFKAYINLPPTEEHDIPPILNDGRAVSIKSKRVGVIKGKAITIHSACSFQVCSSDAARFMHQMLHGPPLTLLLIYYEITASSIVPNETQRVYDISSQKNTIWGNYRTEDARRKIVVQITELSDRFTTAQDSSNVETINNNLEAIRVEVARLQTEMSDNGCSIKLAHKISSKCGLVKGTCKEQCRLQVVLDVKTLTEQAGEYIPPLSPTVFSHPPPKSRGASARGRGASSRGRGASSRGRGANSSGSDEDDMGASARGRSASRGRGASARERSASRGRGASSRGRGDSERGRGASVRGRGASVRGRGAIVRGRGDSERGRGASVRGRGASERGRSANLSGIDEDDMDASARGLSSSRGRVRSRSGARKP